MDNCRTKKELLDEIRAVNFSVIELSQYLDTHRDDKKAVCLHKNNANKLRELIDKYQKMFGPLSITCPCNSWRWVEGPWPWERSDN